VGSARGRLAVERPVGLCWGGSLVGYTAITRDYAVWRRLHPVSGIALYFALTAPWLVAVSAANDEFLHFFFVHEHLQRFLTTEHRRTGEWYYFVPLVLAGSLPWLPVLAYGIQRAWREGVPNALGFSWQRFALVWAAFVFVFFSASGSKSVVHPPDVRAIGAVTGVSCGAGRPHALSPRRQGSVRGGTRVGVGARVRTGRRALGSGRQPRTLVRSGRGSRPRSPS
jgi:hypothetical protein